MPEQITPKSRLIDDVEKTAEVSQWDPNWDLLKNEITFEIGPCLISYTYDPATRKCICRTTDIDTYDLVGTQEFTNVSPAVWSKITDKFCVYNNSDDCEADWGDY